jgi:hypothetical protein
MPRTVESGSDGFPVSDRNCLRRLHERGRYDRASIYPILDAAMLCHIAYIIDGQPYCTPTVSSSRRPGVKGASPGGRATPSIMLETRETSGLP